MKRRFFEWDWFVVGCVLILALIVAFPWIYRPQPHHDAPSCLSNVKQLSLGLLMYSSDFDDRLPDRDGWMDQSLAQLEYNQHRGAIEENHPEVLRCTKLTLDWRSQPQFFGYSFDGRLSNAWTNRYEDLTTIPMIYDSINYVRNASDAFNSLPDPPRHRYGNTIGFLDGHAKGTPLAAAGRFAPPQDHLKP